MKTVLRRKVPNETMSRKFAEKFVQEYLEPAANFTVFFEGSLGAGKTFLVREILRIFGVTDTVSSPTYTYVQEYSGDRNFAHFDCYRLENSADFSARGFLDIAHDDQINKFVEWPQKLTPETLKVFSGQHFTIKIDHENDANAREISLLQKRITN